MQIHRLFCSVIARCARRKQRFIQIIGLISLLWLLRHGLTLQKSPDISILSDGVLAKNLSDSRCALLTIETPTPRVRLGNRMFAYACLYAFARRYERKPFIEIEKTPQYLFDAFKLPSIPRWHTTDVPTDLKVYHAPLKLNRMLKMDTIITTCGTPMKLIGLFQHWDYIAGFRKELLREFEFTDEIRQECDGSMDAIWGQINRHQFRCHVLIGIHARRGDKTSEIAIRNENRPASADYIQRAQQYMLDHLTELSTFNGTHCEPVFIAAGDTPAWHRANIGGLGKQLIFLNRSHTPAVDLCILSKCHHIIATTGTFGQWAAYISGGNATWQSNAVEWGLPHWVSLEPCSRADEVNKPECLPGRVKL